MNMVQFIFYLLYEFWRPKPELFTRVDTWRLMLLFMTMIMIQISSSWSQDTADAVENKPHWFCLHQHREQLFGQFRYLFCIYTSTLSLHIRFIIYG